MPVTLTIDGRQVQVEAGTTILHAARQLGIEIPTLCHLDGVAPIGSCFLCVVHVEGRRNLIPSCAAPAAEGMAVTTHSDDIRAARKMALELLLSDHVGDCEAPCTLACPARLDIAWMLRHIAAGDGRAAIALIKERIPMADSLGRVCPRFCERACRRREIDEPIAICALKRFAADVDREKAERYVPSRAVATGKRVAIVGAGPAGLTAAFFLLREGHACVLYDAHDEPGGMFRHAIPAFRLPRSALAADVDTVTRLGAELRMNHLLGHDVLLEELLDEYDAVLLAIGAQGEEPMEFDGASHARSALEFLHSVAHGTALDVGDHVVVLGGDDAAFDVARTARRMGARATVVWDGSRGALRAFADHVDAAEAEGVTLALDTAPQCLERTKDGRLTLTGRCGDDDVAFDASCVVAAAPRRVEADLLESQDVAVAKGRMQADRGTLATEVDGLFGAGECVSGPTAGVRAATGGRLAAASIHQYLSGREAVGEARMMNVRMGKLTEEQKAILFEGCGTQPRAAGAVLEPARRGPDDEVQTGLSRDDAVREAERCLECDCAARDDCKLRIHATAYDADVKHYAGECRALARDASHADVVYEPGKCILCQLCSRLADQEHERLGMSLLGRGFVTRTSVPFGKPLAEGLTVAARRCAQACPTGALALKRRQPPRDPGE